MTMESFDNLCAENRTALTAEIDKLENLFYEEVRFETKLDISREIVQKKAELEIYDTFRITSKFNPITLLGYLAKLATEHPNDTWSGRGNDHARIIADGKRIALKNLIDRATDIAILHYRQSE